MQEELQGIADKQKFNVDKLVELVKENGEILEKMKVRERLFDICKFAPKRPVT